MKRSLLVHCRRPPYGSSLGREALELALAAAVFDIDVVLLFSGDGVWQLLARQEPAGLGAKSQSALLESLPLYDIQRVFVAAEDLRQRGITMDELALAADAIQAVDATGLQHLLRAADQVVTF